MLPKPPQEQLRLDYGDSMVDITSIPNWRDMTAQQLVTFSQENPQTAGPIKRTDLQEFLRLNRLASIGADGKPEGVVIDLINNGQVPDTLVAQAKGLISKVFYEAHETIDTNSDDHRDLLVSLMGSVSIPQDQIIKFYNYASGRKYPLFTSEAEATAAQAAAILAEETAANLAVLRTKWSAVQGVVEDRLHTGEITTWAEVVLIVEAAG